MWMRGFLINAAGGLEETFRHLKPSRCALKSYLLSVMLAMGTDLPDPGGHVQSPNRSKVSSTTPRQIGHFWAKRASGGRKIAR